MSIETQLTLALAAAILVVAAILRFTILGAIRLALVLSGGRKARPVAAAGGRQSRPRTMPVWPRVLSGAHATVAAIVFLAGAFVDGLTIAAVGVGRATAAVVSTLARIGAVAAATLAHAATVGAREVRPVLSGASRKGARRVAGAAAWFKPRFVLAIATIQHLGRLALDGARARLAERQEERHARPGDPSSAADGPRVIDLDRDWDPLTDDFPEDRVTSSVR